MGSPVGFVETQTPLTLLCDRSPRAGARRRDVHFSTLTDPEPPWRTTGLGPTLSNKDHKAAPGPGFTLERASSLPSQASVCYVPDPSCLELT